MKCQSRSLHVFIVERVQHSLLIIPLDVVVLQRIANARLADKLSIGVAEVLDSVRANGELHASIRALNRSDFVGAIRRRHVTIGFGGHPDWLSRVEDFEQEIGQWDAASVDLVDHGLVDHVCWHDGFLWGSSLLVAWRGAARGHAPLAWARSH